MMRSQIIAAIGLLVLMMSGGCAGPDRPGWLSVNPNNWANRSVTDEPKLLDVSGPTAIDVESFNGDVTIQGDPELKQAKVTVRREAMHGYGREEEATKSLDDITWSAEIVPGELGQVLQVRTASHNAEPYLQRAHVFIEMPDIDGITVKTTNGKVWAQNIRGKVDVSTTEDDVRIATNQPMSRSVTIVNRHGDIDYRVRGESQGRFDARTVNGHASGFARYGQMTISPATQADSFQATLNGGANPIVLRTVNGDIRVAVVSNPELVDVHPFD